MVDKLLDGALTYASIFDQIASRARDHPELLALRSEHQSITYGEFVERVEYAATHLQKLDNVSSAVVSCRSSVNAIIVAIAATKSRLCWTVHQPDDPQARLRQILGVMGNAALIQDEGALRVGGVLNVDIGSDGKFVSHATPQRGAAENRTGPVEKGATYVTFTSGTTGAPKAIPQREIAVIHHALNYGASVGATEGTQMLMLARFGTDAALMDVFTSLLHGGTLNLVDLAQRPSALSAEIVRRGVEVLHCTPTMISRLHSAGTFPVSSVVREVRLGGEIATSNHARSVRAMFPCARLVNGYGPTECSLAAEHVVEDADLEREILPIGEAVSGVTIDLLAVDGQGGLSEIRITSKGVSLPYLNDESARRQFDVSANGSASFLTRDLGYRDGRGAIVLVGRKDRQVKINGHRVEPSAVEAILSRHPEIAEAVVTPMGSPVTLSSFVTSSTSRPPDVDELRGFLSSLLPHYSVPAKIFVVDEIPLRANGKANFEKLLESTSGSGTDEAIIGDVANAVSEEWGSVLGVRPRLSQRFGEAGGDSILLVEFAARLNEYHGFDVDVAELQRLSTLGDVITFIEDGEWESSK